MAHIIFVNRYFYPDHSATSQILSDLAFRLATKGHTIDVVTSQQIYDNPSARLPANEIVGGVNIHRVVTTRFGRAHLIGRALDYVSFYWSMWRRLASLAGPNDIVVAKTDPPLLSIFGALVTKRRSAHLVNWLQDLYPEIAVELGVPLVKGPVGKAIAFLRNRSLRGAACNIVLGNSMAERLRASGVTENRIRVIPNWTNDEEIAPVSSKDNPLRHEWNLEDKFIVGYSGNLGRAHEFDTMLAAADRLREDSRIVFAFIGGGKQFDELAGHVRDRGLDGSFRFFPYQERAVLKYSLSLPDVHWISLRPELEGLIFPSKFYGIAAAGRPMIAIAGKDGEIAQLVTQNKCGLAIAPGDADALTEAIVFLSRDPLRCAEMGRCARAMLDANFSRRQAFDRWQKVLTGLAQL